MYVQMLYRKTALRRGLSFEREDVNVIWVCIVHTYIGCEIQKCGRDAQRIWCAFHYIQQISISKYKDSIAEINSSVGVYNL